MTSTPFAAEARIGPLGLPPTSAAKTASRSTRASPSPGPGDREAHLAPRTAGTPRAFVDSGSVTDTSAVRIPIGDATVPTQRVLVVLAGHDAAS